MSLWTLSLLAPLAAYLVLSSITQYFLLDNIKRRAEEIYPPNDFYLRLEPGVREAFFDFLCGALKWDTSQLLGNVLGALKVIVAVDGNLLNYR